MRRFLEIVRRAIMEIIPTRQIHAWGVTSPISMEPLIQITKRYSFQRIAPSVIQNQHGNLPLSTTMGSIFQFIQENTKANGHSVWIVIMYLQTTVNSHAWVATKIQKQITITMVYQDTFTIVMPA